MTQHNNEEYINLLKKANIALVISSVNFVPTIACILGAAIMYIKEEMAGSYALAIAGFLLCNVGIFLTFIGEKYVRQSLEIR